MANKREKEEQDRKARMLALVGSGAEHFRESQIQISAGLDSPPTVIGVSPRTETLEEGQNQRSLISSRLQEEPVLGPEPDEDPARFLVKRRRSLRDDPAWVGTTLYLRRETHAALHDFCRQAGLDMSRVVQFCVASQMDEKQRSPVLSQLLGDSL